MKAKVAFVLSFWVFIVSPGLIAAQTKLKPLSVEEVEDLLRGGVSSLRVEDIVKQQGVNFKLADDTEKRLRQAGADANLILLIIKVGGRESPSLPSPPDRVTTLLSKARKQEQENKLTTPVGDNALETYQAVLRLAPEQAAALAGVRRIKEGYIQRGREAEGRKEWKKAQTYYQEALEIDPADQLVVAALRRSRERGEEVRPQNQPPQIIQSFPNERDLMIHQGESPSFLVEATDPDNDELTYTWFINDKKVGEGKRFAFTTGEAGRRYRVSLEATDQGGLKAEIWWNVQVEVAVAKVEPRLVMFTPHQSRLSLFLHQSCFFGVQVEVPGVAEPSLRYDWTMNGRSIPGQEIFEFKDQSIGKYDILVTVSTPSGMSLTHRWTVVLRGVQEKDDIGPLWSPRVQIFGTKDPVTTADQPVLTLTGEIRNLDKTRSADNLALWVSSRDRSGKELARRLAIPTPQPLAPGQVGTFAVLIPNSTQGFDFHFEVLGKSREDEDAQRAKEQLLRRAEAALRKQQWEDAESLIIAAMKVYPPDEAKIANLLQEARATRNRAGGAEETNTAEPEIEAKGEEPTRQYRIIASTPLLKAPVESADVITILSANERVNVIGIEGDYLEVQSTKGSPPGYVSRRDATPVQ